MDLVASQKASYIRNLSVADELAVGATAGEGLPSASRLCGGLAGLGEAIKWSAALARVRLRTAVP